MVSLRSALKATNCAVENLMPEEDDPTVCPACHKCLRTARGVQAHLQSARSCSWYKKGKLKALTMPPDNSRKLFFCLKRYQLKLRSMTYLGMVSNKTLRKMKIWNRMRSWMSSMNSYLNSSQLISPSNIQYRWKMRTRTRMRMKTNGW